MFTRGLATLGAVIAISGCGTLPAPLRPKPLVLMTDLGLRDGAVSALKGAAFAADDRVLVSDLTHELRPGDTWQAAVQLEQIFRHWPPGSVFVTVVASGGAEPARSVVMRTKTGHLFVAPDDGTLSLVADAAGLQDLRDLAGNGRDLLVTTGARLANGTLTIEQLGAPAAPLVRLRHQRATVANGMIQGSLPHVDANFGHVWTNVAKAMVSATFPNARELRVYVAFKSKKVFEGKLPLGAGVTSVPRGQALLFFNDAGNLALAVHHANFARLHQVGAGPDWTVVLSKP